MLFRPTYKYDLHSDTYDSGEKMRIPAWTGRFGSVKGSLGVVTECIRGKDRILFKGNCLDLSVYSRAELKSSDHRPGEFTSRPESADY